MKSAVRISLAGIALALSGMLLSGCGQGPQGIPPITLEHARQLKATDHKKALEEYMAVRGEFESKDKETAAQALLEAAQFASNPAEYGTPAQLHIADPAHPGAEGQQALETARAEGETAARLALKQLDQHFHDTKAAAIAREKDANGKDMLNRVEDAIDARNSKTLSFKVVDMLVRLTGSHPDFSYWFALVLIAVFIKGVTFPLLLKTYKSQREMQKIQPVLKEIQAKYKGDQTEIQSRTMAAYKEHGVNPFASCLPSLIQIPIFMLMFRLIQAYEIHFTNGHFLWINPSTASKVNTMLSGSPITKWLEISPDLAHLDMPILILYAASMYISMKLAPSPDPQMAQQQKSMSIMMTGMMIYWFMVTRWSSAFLLYYLVQNILSTWQQYVYIYKPNKLKAMNEVPGPPVADSPARRKPDAPAVSQGVRDVTSREATTGAASAPRNGNAATAASGNRPRPKRKTRR